MAYTPRSPRTTDTKDLWSSIESAGDAWFDGRVLNLSEGGMLVATSSDLDVATLVGFELEGAGFCYAGHGAIAHRTNDAIGVSFWGWQDGADRPVRALIDARVGRQTVRSRRPGELSVRRSPSLDSRAYERASLTGFSVTIEYAPAGIARHHRVLNISEHGMLVAGLTLPLCAPIAFTLQGRGIKHIGHGHVSRRTLATSGVAVDHWDGAPETIRTHITKASGDSQPQESYVTDWA